MVLLYLCIYSLYVITKQHKVFSPLLITKCKMLSDLPIKRRGRKKKTETANDESDTVPKKRGRKPKGGKLTNNDEINSNDVLLQENVILHLKCNILDIDKHIHSKNALNYNPEMPPEIKTYDILEESEYTSYQDAPVNRDFNAYIDTNSTSYICGHCRNSNKCADVDTKPTMEEKKINIKELNHKLKEQKNLLYNGEMNGTNSACFWCTYEFDNKSCYIPKCEEENNIDCYGSFCRPECAVAFLFNESIDDSVKFERYQLLNNIYSKVYNYKRNIKPAPDPHYLLDKFYGNLNIQEYRQLLSGDNLLFMIDKPMTRVFPELFEDNDNFIIGVYGNGTPKPTTTNTNNVYKVKRQSEKIDGANKTKLMKNKFGVTTA